MLYIYVCVCVCMCVCVCVSHQVSGKVIPYLKMQLNTSLFHGIQQKAATFQLQYSLSTFRKCWSNPTFHYTFRGNMPPKVKSQPLNIIEPTSIPSFSILSAFYVLGTGLALNRQKWNQTYSLLHCRSFNLLGLSIK